MNALSCGVLVLVAMACQPKNQATPSPAGGDPENATVHAVLTDHNLVGRTVRVTGTCLGYSTPTLAKGPPPLTRSDWQLADQDEVVWVSGPMPPGCSATEPATAPSTITGTVAQDTLPALGGQTGVVRQFLIRS